MWLRSAWALLASLLASSQSCLPAFFSSPRPQTPWPHWSGSRQDSQDFQRDGMVAGGWAGRWEMEVRMCDRSPGRLLPAWCTRKRRGGKVEEKTSGGCFCLNVALRFSDCWRSVLGEEEGRESYRRALAKSRWSCSRKSCQNTIQSVAVQKIQFNLLQPKMCKSGRRIIWTHNTSYWGLG